MISNKNFELRIEKKSFTQQLNLINDKKTINNLSIKIMILMIFYWIIILIKQNSKKLE